MKTDGDNKNAMMVVGDGVLGAAVLVIIGVYAGNWLDDRFHTAPAISFVLSILGGGAGLARLVSKANSLDSGPASKSNLKPLPKDDSGDDSSSGS